MAKPAHQQRRDPGPRPRIMATRAESKGGPTCNDDVAKGINSTTSDHWDDNYLIGEPSGIKGARFERRRLHIDQSIIIH